MPGPHHGDGFRSLTAVQIAELCRDRLKDRELQIAIEIALRKRAEATLQETVKDLQKASEQIKTLRGIAPICAHCKSIRDDHGYWSQVEVYIRDHTQAEFSHGLCPNCMKSLYPELGQADGSVPENEGGVAELRRRAEAIVGISEKGLITEANLTAADLLGVTRAELLKQPIGLFILSEDQNINDGRKIRDGRESDLRAAKTTITEAVSRQPEKAVNTPKAKGGGTVLLVEDLDMLRNMTR